MPVKFENQNHDSILASLHRCERRQDLILRAFQANQRENHDQKMEFDEQFRLLFKVTDLDADCNPRYINTSSRGGHSKETTAVRLKGLEYRCDSLEKEVRWKLDHANENEGSGRPTDGTKDRATTVKFQRCSRFYGERASEMKRESDTKPIRSDIVSTSSASASVQPKTRRPANRDDLTIDGNPKLKLAWSGPETSSRLVKVGRQWIRVTGETPLKRRKGQ